MESQEQEQTQAQTQAQAQEQTQIEPTQIIVDYREAKLLEHLGQLLPSGHTPVTSNLDIGDVLIKGDGFTLLFERKTASDLAASIKDRRYSEQKARILSTLPPYACTYVLEGCALGQSTSPSPHMTQSVYEGAVIHTMYRDKMHVVTTKDVHATAAFICSVLGKCLANPHYFKQNLHSIQSGGACPSSDYVATLKHKTKKSENIDKYTCYILQLCQIPGISSTIAKEIATIYPTYAILIKTLNDCETYKEKMGALTMIKMIATKKARTIIDYIS
jgi:ERCC4 domain